METNIEQTFAEQVQEVKDEFIRTISGTLMDQKLRISTVNLIIMYNQMRDKLICTCGRELGPGYCNICDNDE